MRRITSAPATPDVRGHEDLVVWRRGVELAMECYRISAAFPAVERRALASRLRRAAVAVVRNVADAHASADERALVHHLSLSQSALEELATHLVLAERLAYAAREDLAPVHALADELGRMLWGLHRVMTGACSRRRPVFVPT